MIGMRMRLECVVAAAASVLSTRKENSDLLVRRKGMARLVVSALGLLSLCATVAGQCDPGEIFLNITYDVGDNPKSVAIGDLDGDGVLDLVVANKNDNNVSVLMGNGDGTFASDVTYGVGNSPQSVAIDDLDGDGVLDLVVANRFSNDVSVLMGNGDGTFATHVTYGAGAGPRSVAIGDLDGDGADRHSRPGTLWKE